MDLSAIIKAVLTIGPNQPNRKIPSLRPGDLLTGKVVKSSVDGPVLMDFGRFQARAQIDWAVQPGQLFTLEVVESGTPLKLRIRDDVGQSAKPPMPPFDFNRTMTTIDHQRLLAMIDRLVKFSNASISRSPFPERILDALGQLKTVLQPIPVSTNANTDQMVRHLQQTIGGSGLFFEKEMAEVEANAGRSGSLHGGETTVQPYRSAIANDLKAQLLQLKSFFAGPGGYVESHTDLSAKEVSFFKNSLEQMATHLQDQQGRMVSRFGESDPMLVVTHHFYVEDQRQPVKLRIYYPKKGRKDRGAGLNRMAMLLNMDRLGPVRVDLAMFGDSLEVGFFVQNETVRQTFESAVDQVKDALSGVYDRVQVVTRISEQKIAQFDREDLSGSGFGMIDIQI
ncbi:MAG: flagellar hook-length control protein FliK [Desulfobacteraceae bacterium]|jgi:hypothetical protein